MIAEWTSFAKTGEPSWAPYRTGATKIFNNGATETILYSKNKENLLEELLLERLAKVYKFLDCFN